MNPGDYYHIYNRANAFEKLFYSEENCRFFLHKCDHFLADVATIYSYALLPNHFHLLVRINDSEKSQGYEKEVVQAFSNLFNSYTKSFNLFHRRRGSLFQKNFKRKLIDTDDYLTNCVLYLHHNAVHHGFCKHPDEWPYTSHANLVSQCTDQAKVALSWFGGIDGYMIRYRTYKVPSNGSAFFD